MITLGASHEQKTQNLLVVLQFLSVSVPRRTAALHEYTDRYFIHCISSIMKGISSC
jgi:hypothetical protein